MAFKTLNKIRDGLGRWFNNSASWVNERGWFPIFNNFINTAMQKINNNTALSISTVFAAIRAISEDIAKMPVHIFRTEGENRVPQPRHRLDTLLNFSPNPLMDAMSFRETIIAHAQGWGNGYAEIVRNAAGEAVQLWPLRPDRVRIKKTDDGRLIYEWTNEKGGTQKIDGRDVFHVHGLGFDGLVGYNVIQYARETLGLAAATEKFGGTFFGNGCNQSGNLRHPQTLSKPAQQRLREQIEQTHQGVANAHKLLILEEGMEFVSNIVAPEQSQFLQTRQFGVIEICRWFRIPPSKVQDLNKSTFNNNEQQNINYVTDSLTSWIKRFELEIWNKLLTEAEQLQGFYAKHNVASLLRGDVKARGLFYKIMWSLGAFSTNEIRAFEDMNPIDGGDQHFVPLNHTPITEAGQNQNPGVASPANLIVSNIARRIAAAEIREVEKHIEHRKDDAKFQDWVAAFYEKHEKYVTDSLEALDAFGFDEPVNIDNLTLKAKLTAGMDVDLDIGQRKDHVKAYILGAMSHVRV